jgi:hypothetical protein
VIARRQKYWGNGVPAELKLVAVILGILIATASFATGIIRSIREVNGKYSLGVFQASTQGIPQFASPEDLRRTLLDTGYGADCFTEVQPRIRITGGLSPERYQVEWIDPGTAEVVRTEHADGPPFDLAAPKFKDGLVLLLSTPDSPAKRSVTGKR